MAIYTNTMRYTGLSGIDTESMVTALMKAESLKLDKLKQQNQLTLWKQTAYFNTSDIFKTFQNNFLALGSANSARLSSTFLRNVSTVKTSAGMDTAAVKITSSANAEIGKYKIDVMELAAKDTYAGDSGTAKAKIISAIDWDDPEVYENLKGDDSIQISLDGVTKTLKFTQSEIDALRGEPDSQKANAFKDMLQAKLDNAFGKENSGTTSKITVDITGGTLKLTAGTGHTATIQGGNIRNTAVKAEFGINLEDVLDLPNPDDTEGTQFSLNVSQDGSDRTISFNLKGDMNASQIAAAINTAITDAGIQSGLKITVNADSTLSLSVNNTNSTVTVSNAETGPYKNVLEALGFTTGNSIDIEKTNALTDFGFTAGKTTRLDITQSISQVFDITDSDISFEINNKEFTFSTGMSVQAMMNMVNSANIGVRLSLDALSESFKLESTNTGTAYAIKTDTEKANPASFLFGPKGLQLQTTEKIKASDSRFSFNDVETTRDSNSIEIAGIRMDLTQVTSGPVTISIEKDLSGTLDTVKKFVEAYNNMIDGMNSALNTARPKKDSYNYFEPLTADQKEAMKENDVRNWEEKAQQGLLYNDDLLQSISTSLRGILYQPVELANGTKISLYEIGITTSNNIRDGGKLIIDENKLSKALETRGAEIAELFTKTADIAYRPGVNDRNRLAQEGIAERINDIINNAIGTSGSITKRAGMKGDTLLEMSSVMYRTIKDQNDRMAEMLLYLRNKENSYYQMFSRMEQAITSANNQMAYLQAQLGF